MIAAYVRNSRKELAAMPALNLKRFMELRYDIMSAKHPHKTFSVEYATPEFFENAHGHILGILPIPTNTPERKLSEYDHNYIAWIKQAQSEK